MRLGRYACELASGSLARKIYGTDLIHERHRHRFEFNCLYEPALAEKGMRISGRSPDGKFVEIAELPGHPWFVAVQFHPEFQSRPLKPHPLFASFVEASKRHKQGAGTTRPACASSRARLPRRRRYSMQAVTPVSAGAVSFGTGHPLAFILGPCVIESEGHAHRDRRRDRRDREARRRAGRLQGLVRQGESHIDHARIRGPGLEEGLRVLGKVKERTGSADPHRHSRRQPGRARRRGRRHPADSRVSVAADRSASSPRRRPAAPSTSRRASSSRRRT